MKIKQLTALCLAFLLIAALFAACAKSGDEETTTDAEESLVIDLNRVIGNGEEESRTVHVSDMTKAEAISVSTVTTTAAATSTTAPVSTTAKTTTTAPASTTVAATTAASTTATTSTTAPAKNDETTTKKDETTTATTEPTTVKTLNAVQTAWKNIASASGYVSQNDLINALGGANNAYQTGSARGCTNKLTPGSAYIYGDSSSTNVRVITSLNPDEIVYEVILMDNTYATPEGLSVGDSILSAKQLYGNPDWESEENNDQIMYNLNNPYYSLVINYDKNGIITGINLHAKDD